jgi:hypothetical protein
MMHAEVAATPGGIASVHCNDRAGGQDDGASGAEG